MNDELLQWVVLSLLRDYTLVHKFSAESIGRMEAELNHCWLWVTVYIVTLMSREQSEKCFWVSVQLLPSNL